MTALALLQRAPASALPEIRFVPVRASSSCVLLALDLRRARSCRVLPASGGRRRWRSRSASCAGCRLSRLHPDWIHWNYEGIESEAVVRRCCSRSSPPCRARSADPRVAYENSPSHERFGSMRIFESLPLLAGPRRRSKACCCRPPSPRRSSTTPVAGLGAGHAASSPAIPIPTLTRCAARARLDLFNARDFHRRHGGGEGRARQGPALGARLRAAAVRRSSGARTPTGTTCACRSYQPVLLETTALEEGLPPLVRRRRRLDVPLVAASTVPPAERARFPLAGRRRPASCRASRSTAVRITEQHRPHGDRVHDHVPRACRTGSRCRTTRTGASRARRASTWPARPS